MRDEAEAGTQRAQHEGSRTKSAANPRRDGDSGRSFEVLWKEKRELEKQMLGANCRGVWVVWVGLLGCRQNGGDNDVARG